MSGGNTTNAVSPIRFPLIPIKTTIIVTMNFDLKLLASDRIPFKNPLPFATPSPNVAINTAPIGAKLAHTDGKLFKISAIPADVSRLTAATSLSFTGLTALTPAAAQMAERTSVKKKNAINI